MREHTPAAQNCFAFAVLLIFLLGIFIGSQIPWIGPADLSYLATEIINPTISKIISWPVAILLIVMFLGLSRTGAQRISNIFNGIRSLKVMGAEIDFSKEGARELQESAEQAFDKFRGYVATEFRRQVYAQNIKVKLENVFLEDIKNDGMEKNVKALCSTTDFRCTIYVQDILFENTLYQLTDYYPSDREHSSGRRFSIRFGSIGRCWRMRLNYSEPFVKDGEEKALIKEFGMTSEEASIKSRRVPSFMCVYLKDSNHAPLAVMYMDSGKENAFGANEIESAPLAERIAEKCGQVGLVSALEDIVRELRKYSAPVKVES